MKLSTKAICSFAALTVTISTLLSGEPQSGGGISNRNKGTETKQDLPGDFHSYYGQKLNRYRDLNRRIARIDLDADLNYDGSIRQGDAQDQGGFEQTPPGLILGEGEMSKIVIEVKPYRIDFEGDVVVGLEVCGINRAAESGEFGSFEEEQQSVGRVRVWRDAARTELLLDSANPQMRLIEFAISAERYPANLPSIIPRFVYVEGVKPSGAYLGDVRILGTVAHRGKGDPTRGVDTPSPPLKLFRTAFDHILITVQEEPVRKDFVNNNAEGVWVSPASRSTK
ncbi:hypothetical protein [Verrucomicrobium sp. BvORR034]|jgi:hypothetical protein|uniref:hypothetical protein n=1 Tax=Verrucomicrobium sp. BvORR034 TaxID=1396418 RepID=UPI000678D5F6|nr:hypothetical protein [Verrucomicrobium sp. BvORR034]